MRLIFQWQALVLALGLNRPGCSPRRKKGEHVVLLWAMTLEWCPAEPLARLHDELGQERR